MVTASQGAMKKLREQLLYKLLEAGIGFRILVATDESGATTFSIKIDKCQRGDKVVDSGDVRLFLDPLSAAQIRDYQLDYQDGTNDGFFLCVLQENKDGWN